MPDSDVSKLNNLIAELKVSGHTMALEPGLYCVFSPPGSAAQSAETGLPAVRIGAGPGRATGRVDIVGLHEDGWIGPESATLIRVEDARSNVLVTVYQAKDSRADAPQIQVVRLSGEAVAPAAGEPAQVPGPAVSLAVPAQPRTPKNVNVVAHIYGLGDVGGDLGAWMGERGSKRWIEGFAVAPVGGVPPADLEYQAVLGRGWLSPWSAGGQFCGSRSMALPILGLRVRLRGASAETHRVVLSATFVDGSEVGPVSDGDPCEAASLAALEAFHLAFEPVAGASTAPKAAARRSVPAASPPAGAKRGGKTVPPAPVKASRSTTLAKAKAMVATIPPPAEKAAPARAAKQKPAPAPKRSR